LNHPKPPQRIGYYPGQQNLAPQPASQHSSGRRRRKLNSVRLLALCVCIAVFCTCLFLLVRYAVNIIISRNASAQLEDVYNAAQQPSNEPSPTVSLTPSPSPVPTPAALPAALTADGQPTATPSVLQIWPTSYPDNPTLRVSSVFYQLQAQNRDIVGWLKIDGVLEEAVVQRDNEYYLTHNALHQKSVTGALFLDESCNLDTVPSHMVIHGHNMKEGAMFGSLKKYKVKDASYYREHPFIDFNTIYENGRYVIFAVVEVDIRSSKPDYLPFWNYSRFSSVSAFTSFVERAQLLSHYRCNVDVQPGDRLLTLSTCTGTDENKRLLVMARKLRPYENELELNIGIYSTTDR